MSKIKKNLKMEKYFADGARAEAAGEVEGTNPHTPGTPAFRAWSAGHRTATVVTNGPVAHTDTKVTNTGDLVLSNGRIYQSINAGTTGTGTAPTGKSPGQVDGDVVWNMAADGPLLDLARVAKGNPGGSVYIGTWI